MSFFQSVKAAASTAAQITKAAAQSAAASAKATYADLKAPPSKIRCLGCPLEVDVPVNAWDWTCPAGHVNRRTDELCVECKVARPASTPDVRVTCPTCGTSSPVPSTNAAKHAKDAARDTKRTVVAVAAATKAGVEHLRAAPTTFHCAHCDTLLAVPTGPWACQTCTTENEEELKNCKQCGQKKADQKAICGVCRQSTVIPSSNFVDGFKHTVKDISQSSKKIYYDVAGKPYVTCQRCGAHANVATLAVVGGAPAAEHKQPHADEAGKGSAPEGVPNADAGAGAAAEAAAAAAGQPTHLQQGQIVMCPNCKNPIE